MNRRRILALGLGALAQSALGLGLVSTVTAEPVRFRIEPEASEITFKATSRLMNADGKFRAFAGDVVIDPRDLATARATLTVDAASIDTGIAMRDNHLRSEDFFDVRRFPSVTFESVRVEPGPRPTVVGFLTIRGVRRELAVPVDVQVTEAALVVEGQFTIKRTDYGIAYQSRINPVGDAVHVAFTFRARRGRS